MVAAAGWIGHTLAGRRGTAWAALAAGALVANPMIGTTEINAELLGAPPMDKTDVVGTWLRDASIAGDTRTVLYGNADLLLTAGLPPGTDQLWSLPFQPLDCP